MNVNDSERVAGLLQSRGLEASESAAEADFVFLNTCAVREKATEKFQHSLGRLRRLKAQRPDLRIGVGGCVAQLEGETLLERARHVDVLVGTHNLHRVPELLDEAAATGRVAIDLDRKADAFAIPEEVTAHGNPVRAFVTAMEGCNHVCSFCVVPRTRGPEVNRSPEDIVREVEGLVARGFAEVMLLGQTVNAYRQGDTDFAGLLARVDGVEGLRRLRFTTSHPEHVDAGMAAALRHLAARVPLSPPAVPVRVRSGAELDASGLHEAAVPRYRRAPPGPGAGARPVERRHRRLPRRNRGRVRGDGPGAGDGRLRRPLHVRVLPAPGNDRAPAERRRARRREAAPPPRRERPPAAVAAAPQRGLHREGRGGPGGDRRRGRPCLGPDSPLPHRPLRRSADLVGQFVTVEITGAGPNSLQGRLSQAVH